VFFPPYPYLRAVFLAMTPEYPLPPRLHLNIRRTQANQSRHPPHVFFPFAPVTNGLLITSYSPRFPASAHPPFCVRRPPLNPLYPPAVDVIPCTPPTLLGVPPIVLSRLPPHAIFGQPPHFRTRLHAPNTLDSQLRFFFFKAVPLFQPTLPLPVKVFFSTVPR